MHRERTPRSQRRLRLAAVSFASLLPALTPPTTAIAGDDVPLPLTGSKSVKAIGKRYVVDGKQTIPAGSVIRLEANVRVVGINGASLDVKGGLRSSGLDGGRVAIEDVDFSPTLAPSNELHFDMTDLKGCSFAHAEGSSFSGGFTMENSSYGGGTFAVRMKAGYLRIMSVKFNAACAIESVPDKGQPPEIAIRTSTLQGLTLTGSAMATVRSASLKGGVHARGFTSLVVDGCDISGDATFSQPDEGSFSKLQLTKCNLLAGARLVFQRPVGPKASMERVRLDKFFFDAGDGRPEPADKIADRIQDGVDDPNVSVKAYWQSTQGRPH